MLVLRMANYEIANRVDQEPWTGPKAIAAVLTPLARLEVTHWLARLLGEHLDIEHSMVASIWKEDGVKPSKGGCVQVLHRSGGGGQSLRRDSISHHGMISNAKPSTEIVPLGARPHGQDQGSSS